MASDHPDHHPSPSQTTPVVRLPLDYKFPDPIHSDHVGGLDQELISSADSEPTTHDTHHHHHPSSSSGDLSPISPSQSPSHQPSTPHGHDHDHQHQHQHQHHNPLHSPPRSTISSLLERSDPIETDWSILSLLPASSNRAAQPDQKPSTDSIPDPQTINPYPPTPQRITTTIDDPPLDLQPTHPSNDHHPLVPQDSTPIVNSTPPIIHPTPILTHHHHLLPSTNPGLPSLDSVDQPRPKPQVSRCHRWLEDLSNTTVYDPNQEFPESDLNIKNLSIDQILRSSQLTSELGPNDSGSQCIYQSRKKFNPTEKDPPTNLVQPAIESIEGPLEGLLDPSMDLSSSYLQLKDQPAPTKDQNSPSNLNPTSSNQPTSPRSSPDPSSSPDSCRNHTPPVPNPSSDSSPPPSLASKRSKTHIQTPNRHERFRCWSPLFHIGLPLLFATFILPRSWKKIVKRPENVDRKPSSDQSDSIPTDSTLVHPPDVVRDDSSSSKVSQPLSQLSVNSPALTHRDEYLSEQQDRPEEDNHRLVSTNPQDQPDSDELVSSKPNNHVEESEPISIHTSTHVDDPLENPPQSLSDEKSEELVPSTPDQKQSESMRTSTTTQTNVLLHDLIHDPSDPFTSSPDHHQANHVPKVVDQFDPLPPPVSDTDGLPPVQQSNTLPPIDRFPSALTIVLLLGGFMIVVKGLFRRGDRKTSRDHDHPQNPQRETVDGLISCLDLPMKDSKKNHDGFDCEMFLDNLKKISKEVTSLNRLMKLLESRIRTKSVEDGIVELGLLAWSKGQVGDFEGSCKLWLRFWDRDHGKLLGDEKQQMGVLTKLVPSQSILNVVQNLGQTWLSSVDTDGPSSLTVNGADDDQKTELDHKLRRSRRSPRRSIVKSENRDDLLSSKHNSTFDPTNTILQRSTGLNMNDQTIHHGKSNNYRRSKDNDLHHSTLLKIKKEDPEGSDSDRTTRAGMNSSVDQYDHGQIDDDGGYDVKSLKRNTKRRGSSLKNKPNTKINIFEDSTMQDSSISLDRSSIDAPRKSSRRITPVNDTTPPNPNPSPNKLNKLTASSSITRSSKIRKSTPGSTVTPNQPKVIIPKLSKRLEQDRRDEDEDDRTNLSRNKRKIKTLDVQQHHQNNNNNKDSNHSSLFNPNPASLSHHQSLPIVKIPKLKS